MVGALPIGAPAMAAIAAVVVGVLVVFWPSSTSLGDRAARNGWAALAILYLALVPWFLHAHLSSGAPLVGVLLFTLAAAFNAAAIRWIFRRPALVEQGIGVPLLVVGLNIGLMAATYPVAPGGESPIVHPFDAGTDQGDGNWPNVVLIILDTVRADRMSLYVYREPTTPRLGEFATQATVFEQAYAYSTYSLPSHASILTGLLPHQHGANFSVRRSTGETADPSLDIFPARLSEDVATIPEVLGRLGIRTAMLSANYGYLASPFGLDRGFAYADSRPQNLLPVEFVGGQVLRQLPWTSWRHRYEWLAQTPYPAPHVIQRVTRWLDEHGADQFFLLINFMDVHEPSSTSSFDPVRSDRSPRRCV